MHVIKRSEKNDDYRDVFHDQSQAWIPQMPETCEYANYCILFSLVGSPLDRPSHQIPRLLLFHYRHYINLNWHICGGSITPSLCIISMNWHSKLSHKLLCAFLINCLVAVTDNDTINWHVTTTRHHEAEWYASIDGRLAAAYRQCNFLSSASDNDRFLTILHLWWLYGHGHQCPVGLTSSTLLPISVL